MLDKGVDVAAGHVLELGVDEFIGVEPALLGGMGAGCDHIAGVWKRADQVVQPSADLLSLFLGRFIEPIDQDQGLAGLEPVVDPTVRGTAAEGVGRLLWKLLGLREPSLGEVAQLDQKGHAPIERLQAAFQAPRGGEDGEPLQQGRLARAGGAADEQPSVGGEGLVSRDRIAEMLGVGAGAGPGAKMGVLDREGDVGDAEVVALVGLPKVDAEELELVVSAHAGVAVVGLEGVRLIDDDTVHTVDDLLRHSADAPEQLGVYAFLEAREVRGHIDDELGGVGEDAAVDLLFGLREQAIVRVAPGQRRVAAGGAGAAQEILDQGVVVEVVLDQGLGVDGGTGEGLGSGVGDQAQVLLRDVAGFPAQDLVDAVARQIADFLAEQGLGIVPSEQIGDLLDQQPAQLAGTGSSDLVILEPQLEGRFGDGGADAGDRGFE